MRKKQGIIILSAFFIIISTILLINKPSYAIAEICPLDTTITADAATTAYIQKGNNKIALPSNIDYINNSKDNNSNPIFLTLNGIFNRYIYSDSTLGEQSAINNRKLTSSNTFSILLGYLVNDTTFSTNPKEDNYYKQLLILWALDRLEGYKDEYNYIFSLENDGIIESPKETSYDDKFEIIDYRDKIINWKFQNRLSAGDKEMLKESDVGNKMLNYLDEWEKYIKWYIEDNQQVQLNPITKDNITYHVTNDYIETNLITPTSVNKVYKNKFTNYQVEVASPMLIVNSDGEEQTEFTAKEGFKIRIPIDKIENKSIDYSIKIQGYFNFPAMLIYKDKRPVRAGTSSEQETIVTELSNIGIIKECMKTEEKTAEQTLEFKQEVGTINLKVIDANTNKNLADAEVAIFDENGNEVYRYKTKQSELNITLPVGTYTIKQIVTPPNYQARETTITLDVTKDQKAVAVLENVQLISVPDTLKTTTTITITGIIIILLGTIIIIYTKKMKAR